MLSVHINVRKVSKKTVVSAHARGAGRRNFTPVLSRKSNKSSRESTASSHSPASYRNATSHQANNVPKHRANDNGHGKRRGDRRLCRRSPTAASMRLQLLGQEMFCEAFCYFPDDYVGTSALAVQALHFNNITHAMSALGSEADVRERSPHVRLERT